MILMSPFQPGIFYDFMMLCYRGGEQRNGADSATVVRDIPEAELLHLQSLCC